MSSLFKSSEKQTTQQSQPWAPAQPALQQGLTDAMKVYKSGVGSQPYMGSTVVPYAQQSIQGMNQLQAGANAALPMFQQNLERINAQAQNGGLNDLQRQQVANLQPFANGNPQEGLAQLNDIQRQAYEYLNPIAGGSDMNGNPYLDEVIQRSSRDIMGASNVGASAAGRYGSGSHQGVTERNVGDMSSGLRFSDYNNQLGRKDAAIRDVFGIGNQANSQYESDMGRKMDAIGSLYNAGQQQQQNVLANTSALGDAYGLSQAPSQTLQEIGGQYEDLYGRQINDQIRMFNEKQQQPWNQLSKLNAIASGAGGMGGTSTATAQGPSKLQQGIGGALGGYGMLGPLGAVGGGLMGLLGG